MDSRHTQPDVRHARIGRRTAWAVVLATAAIACLPAGASAASGCGRVASTTGNDKSPGTEVAPFRTFKQLVSSLKPGQYGCLRGGVYDEDPTIRVSGTPSAPIFITSYPGEWATLYGRLSVEDNVTRVVVQHMTLDGAGAPNDGSSKLPSPTVHGDDVAFISNEVTNRHTAICFAVGNESYGRAYNVTIRGNRIHDCGVLPPTNHQHGIYLHSPCCAQVTDNWIHDNADTGLNLFPNADENYFARNVVYGNADNLSFAGSSEGGVCESSDRNLAENNVFSHPRVRKNITSWSPCGSEGIGNVLRHNCIYPPTFEGDGYALQNNLYVDPQYVDPGNADFRLQAGSPCAPLLDHPDLPGTGPLPVPGIHPVAPPIGQLFGLAQGQLPGGRPTGTAAGVTLRALRRWVRPGGRIVLTGRVAESGFRKRVRIQLRVKRRWVRVSAVAQKAGGRFRTGLRLRRLARKANASRAPLALRRVRLPRRVRTLVLRAQVRGVGRSAPVRVRLRR
jgi:Right handed beta helix region